MDAHLGGLSLGGFPMTAICVMPRSRFGAWSVMLGVGFVLLETAFSMLVSSGQRGGATFWSNLLLAVPTVGAGVCGVAAGVSAALALTLKRDRAVVVLITLLLGLFVILFVAASVSSRLEVGIAAVLIFSVPIFLWKGRSRATMSLLLTTVRGAALACWTSCGSTCRLRGDSRS